ncbi:MAG: ATP-binding protein, partial [Methanothrix sp.]|nr:ATP-binding protein [Methanothrix sp.]
LSKSMRFFNTAGPVNSSKHYCLPPLSRFNLPQILGLIEQEKYFVLHAPRQTGKTSCLLALMEYLNREGKYRALYANLEAAQGARENVGEAMRAILGEIAEEARILLSNDTLKNIAAAALQDQGPYNSLNYLLTRFAEDSDKPLVILMDEIDSLVGDTLISVLRQLRAGYARRPRSFPSSIVLCGVRDVRDYRIHSDRDKVVITGGSAFNIKAESLRLGNFSRSEVETLYRRHTEETGQAFEADALDKAWALTAGQPWLVNALAYETCFRMPEGLDRSMPVTCEMISRAKENMIARRETHLDQLADKLREERVRRVIEPLLAGTTKPEQPSEDDVQYVEDLGLITTKGQMRISNEIYREVIPRVLTYTTQITIAQEPAWYIQTDGRLDLSKLLEAFQQFFREHSESWLERFDYREAGPQLLMQAFLQRIVNGGGRVEREYGLGRGRTDLLVIWPFAEGVQRAVIELKVMHKSRARTIQEGLAQVREYVDRCGAAQAHLVVFDRTPGKPWSRKIFRKKEKGIELAIGIWGM